jgi:cytidylate kinase
MIRVITIEREYGSGAAEIAQALADRLGWRLWDQALTNEIARLLECDCRVVEEREERRDPFFYRLLKAFMRGSHEGSLNAAHLKIADTECIREVAERVVRRAAEDGNCVIVGRGSAYYLQGRPDVFQVFVYAPLEEKVKNLAAAGKSQAEAVELASSVDRDRADFIRRYFNVEWPVRQWFNLMINAAMGEEAVVETILDGVARAGGPRVESSKSTEAHTPATR